MSSALDKKYSELLTYEQTNTNTLYIKIVQAVFMVILWTALAVDRYQHNKSKRELKKDLFLVGCLHYQALQ
ncbi:MAG: hypothetical protein ACTHUB_04190 [Leuconostoc mesenteroides]